MLHKTRESRTQRIQSIRPTHAIKRFSTRLFVFRLIGCLCARNTRRDNYRRCARNDSLRVRTAADTVSTSRSRRVADNNRISFYAFVLICKRHVCTRNNDVLCDDDGDDSRRDWFYSLKRSAANFTRVTRCSRTGAGKSLARLTTQISARARVYIVSVARLHRPISETPYTYRDSFIADSNYPFPANCPPVVFDGGRSCNATNMCQSVLLKKHTHTHISFDSVVVDVPEADFRSTSESDNVLVCHRVQISQWSVQRKRDHAIATRHGNRYRLFH